MAEQKHRLNREDMEKVIKGGGSVIHQGRHIARVEDLPTDADLASTPEDTDAALDDIQRQRLELDIQERKLRERGQQPAGLVSLTGGKGMVSEPFVAGTTSGPGNQQNPPLVRTMKELVDAGQKGDALKGASDYDAKVAKQLVADKEKADAEAAKK